MSAIVAAEKQKLIYSLLSLGVSAAEEVRWSRGMGKRGAVETT